MRRRMVMSKVVSLQEAIQVKTAYYSVFLHS